MEMARPRARPVILMTENVLFLQIFRRAIIKLFLNIA
jgi:hypothetical protein